MNSLTEHVKSQVVVCWVVSVSPDRINTVHGILRMNAVSQPFPDILEVSQVLCVNTMDTQNRIKSQICASDLQCSPHSFLPTTSYPQSNDVTALQIVASVVLVHRARLIKITRYYLVRNQILKQRGFHFSSSLNVVDCRFVREKIVFQVNKILYGAASFISRQ